MDVNYITQLNGALSRFGGDGRITAVHRSLYLAFFELWNRQRFPEVFAVSGREVMRLAKIRSKTTYHKRVVELNAYGYLDYRPSHDPARGSKIGMAIFCTQPVQKMDLGQPKNDRPLVQKMVSLNKHNIKHINGSKWTRPKNEQVVAEYFKGQKWPAGEGKKFFWYYEAIGWKMGGKYPIEDWQACAKSWMIKADEIKNEQKSKPMQHPGDWGGGKISFKRDKNYGEPL